MCGISYKSALKMFWGFVECFINLKELGLYFPRHEWESFILNLFKEIIRGSFVNIIGDIDGILIFILKPTFFECIEVRCIKGLIELSQKDKYGLNVQYICYPKLHFWWIGVKCSVSTSDYMEWIMTTLFQKL